MFLLMVYKVFNINVTRGFSTMSIESPEAMSLNEKQLHNNIYHTHRVKIKHLLP